MVHFYWFCLWYLHLSATFCLCLCRLLGGRLDKLTRVQAAVTAIVVAHAFFD